MRYKNILTVLLTLVIFSSFAYANPADEDDVKTVVTNYASGVDAGKGNEVENLFWEEATVVSMNMFRNEVSKMDAAAYADMINGKKIGGWKRNLEFKDVDVSGNSAFVKIELTDSKLRQVEYVTLLKVDGNWKIVSSTFTLDKK